MKWVFDDGGALQHHKHIADDCVARAFSIASGWPYLQVCEVIKRFAAIERVSKRRTGKSTPRSGVYKPTVKRVAQALGGVWHPTMQIGTGCKVHLRDGEVPSGRIVVQLSKHVAAVIDGVIHDAYDPSREGTRCVYGYWTF